MQPKARNGSRHLASPRREIASLAAEMMAREGIGDYGFAKRKAARRLGVLPTAGLPDNDEIERALRAYQSLYQGDEHLRRIRELRRIALDLMVRLEDYSPYLVGHALEGTAGRFAGIDLHLYADSAKSVEIFLLSQGFDFAPAAPRRNRNEVPEMELDLMWKDTRIHVAVFPAARERVRARRHDGRTRPRAGIRALRALLGQDD